MNDILLNIISILITTILLPLLSIIGVQLTKYINTKIKNEENAKLIESATNIVIDAVRMVFQTYVEELKENKTFDKEKQQIALNKAKETALLQMNQEVKDFIKNYYGDLNVWLDNQIETSINVLKNNK